MEKLNCTWSFSNRQKFAIFSYFIVRAHAFTKALSNLFILSLFTGALADWFLTQTTTRARPRTCWTCQLCCPTRTSTGTSASVTGRWTMDSTTRSSPWGAYKAHPTPTSRTTSCSQKLVCAVCAVFVFVFARPSFWTPKCTFKKLSQL